MIKISLYTENTDIIHALEEERIFDTELNSSSPHGDICMVDCAYLPQFAANIFRPCIAVINKSDENVPFECDYVVQAPFDVNCITRIFGFIGSGKHTDNKFTGTMYKISELFKELGMDSGLLGFPYAVYAVELYIKNNGMIRLIDICARIAHENNTTPGAVERAIRTAVEKTWQYGNIQKMYDMFGNSINPEKGKPSNFEFIAGIARQFIDGSRQ